MAQVLQVRHVLHQLQLQLHLLLPQESAAVVSIVLLIIVCPLLALLILRRPSTAATARRAREQLLSKLPSPPGRLPVIGHLHLVGSLPHVSLRDLAARHGRDGLMLLRLGAVPTLVVSSPRAAQAVLRTHDHVFASRAYSPVTDILFYGSTDVAFAPYGEHWRQVRKIATTHLLTTRKVRSYRRAREHEVRLVVAKIREAGSAVDLSDLLNCFTNDVVCHAVSGKFFREEGRNRLFRELVEANSSLIGGFNVEDYFPALVKLDVVKRMVCAKARKVNRMWDELLDKLIDDHASRPAPERDGEESDFIDVLLSVQQEYKLTRDHIKAQLAVSIY
jgi:cytochrome P450